MLWEPLLFCNCSFATEVMDCQLDSLPKTSNDACNIFQRRGTLFIHLNVNGLLSKTVEIRYIAKPTNANVKSRSPSCASASTKNTIFFPCTGIFLSVYELKKFNYKVEKIFSSILSQLNCWMQPIKKQNKRCQKSKWKIKISMYSRYFNVCIPAIENWFQYKQKWHKVISVIIIKCFFICH